MDTSKHHPSPSRGRYRATSEDCDEIPEPQPGGSLPEDSPHILDEIDSELTRPSPINISQSEAQQMAPATDPVTSGFCPAMSGPSLKSGPPANGKKFSLRKLRITLIYIIEPGAGARTSSPSVPPRRHRLLQKQSISNAASRDYQLSDCPPTIGVGTASPGPSDAMDIDLPGPSGNHVVPLTDILGTVEDTVHRDAASIGKSLEPIIRQCSLLTLPLHSLPFPARRCIVCFTALCIMVHRTAWHTPPRRRRSGTTCGAQS